MPKTRPIDLKNNTKTYDHSSNGPQSEEARRAVQAAKDQERVRSLFEIIGVDAAHRAITRARDQGPITAAGTPRKLSAETSPKWRLSWESNALSPSRNQ